jgi:hypothetical protein
VSSPTQTDQAEGHEVRRDDRRRLGLPGRVAAEIEQMKDVRVGPTADRSVVVSMNDFIFLADHRRDGAWDATERD